MSYRASQSLTVILLLLFVPTTLAKLTDYQQFVSYPYLEKAYRLQAEGKYSSAILELKSAIEFAPEHQPYQVLLFELLLANGQTNEAFAVYSAIPKDSRGTLLSRLIEAQIIDNNLDLTDELKQLIEDTPPQQRQYHYQVVASRLIAKGQDSLTYEWLSEIDNLPPELLEVQMRLANKLGEFDEIEKYFLQIPLENRTADAERLYALTLLKIGKTQEALNFAQEDPKSQLSFDIYYQYLQANIAASNIPETNTAFAWIEKYHQLNSSLLEQKLEHAIHSKDKVTAFAVMSHLHKSCQKRIDLALSFNWISRAKLDLLSCENTMQQELWLSYAATLLSNQQLQNLITSGAKYSRSISKILISRYVAQQEYQLAVNQINQAKLADSYIETLAFSYEKLGQLDLATKQFIALYRDAKDDQYLDTASFLLLKQNKHTETLALLEKRLIAAPQSMPQNLVERISQLYQQLPNTLTSVAIDSLAKVSFSQDTVAEMLRLNQDCNSAVEILTQANINTALSWTTRALCSANEDPALALQYWQKSYELTPSDETLRAIAYAQGNLGKHSAAIDSLDKLGELNWNQADFLYLAQLYYQQQNYQKAQEFWLLAENDTETWLDFGIELAIQQKQYTKAQALSTQLINQRNEFNEQQWARQAIIYQGTGQKNKEIRAWQNATELAPEQETYQLSLAYSLIDSQPQQAYKILQNLSEREAEIDTIIWQQLGYIAAKNNQQDAAIHYVKKGIETNTQGSEPKTAELNWNMHQYYRDLSQNWHFSASFSQGSGAILGEVFYENSNLGVDSLPTNNISSRAEYFFNTTNKKWSVYAQLSANGSDSRPLSDWSQELGVSYKIFDQHNIKTSLGAQRFVSGDWEAIVRLNGSLFDQGEWRNGWRFEEAWWQRLFYFDVLYLPKSEQLLGLARFDIGHTEALKTSSKQTISYYGLAQYDFRRLEIGPQRALSSYNQSSLGLGLKWNLYTTPDFYYDRVHSYSLALEWRLTVSGNLTNDNHGIFVIGSYFY
ncbi:NfrA family protein [Paraglaciecola marina]|uniref:NfrA family protein n=1 Tax=Paraglaciecola marina TaxID=2500157 RepID=UPI001061428A|nr:tetratricopeptide repeat protein [Paraglaciecola marina]